MAGHTVEDRLRQVAARLTPTVYASVVCSTAETIGSGANAGIPFDSVAYAIGMAVPILPDEPIIALTVPASGVWGLTLGVGWSDGAGSTGDREIGIFAGGQSVASSRTAPAPGGNTRLCATATPVLRQGASVVPYVFQASGGDLNLRPESRVHLDMWLIATVQVGETGMSV